MRQNGMTASAVILGEPPTTAEQEAQAVAVRTAYEKTAAAHPEKAEKLAALRAAMSGAVVDNAQLAALAASIQPNGEFP